MKHIMAAMKKRMTSGQAAGKPALVAFSSPAAFSSSAQLNFTCERMVLMSPTLSPVEAVGQGAVSPILRA